MRQDLEGDAVVELARDEGDQPVLLLLGLPLPREVELAGAPVRSGDRLAGQDEVEQAEVGGNLDGIGRRVPQKAAGDGVGAAGDDHPRSRVALHDEGWTAVDGDVQRPVAIAAGERRQVVRGERARDLLREAPFALFDAERELGRPQALAIGRAASGASRHSKDEWALDVLVALERPGHPGLERLGDGDGCGDGGGQK